MGRIFNFKLGCFDDVCVLIYADAHPHLYLKTWPRFSPVSLSLSMERHRETIKEEEIKIEKNGKNEREGKRMKLLSAVTVYLFHQE